jgi:hypothetical protein
MTPGATSEYQKIQSSSFRCARTGRELQPGERFFSVIFDRGAHLVREDYSSQAWQGPPADAFSFWMSRVPPRDQGKRLHIDEELLLDCFQRLVEGSEPKKVHFRYILALLLMRRKRLKFEEMRLENGQEHLLLRCPRTRAMHRVLNPQLTEEELEKVQEEVQKVLGLSV